MVYWSSLVHVKKRKKTSIVLVLANNIQNGVKSTFIRFFIPKQLTNYLSEDTHDLAIITFNISVHFKNFNLKITTLFIALINFDNLIIFLSDRKTFQSI
jgi:hypothetical protein